MRKWRHKRRMDAVLKRPAAMLPLRRCPANSDPFAAGPSSDFLPDRLREFQQWFRTRAQPGEKSCQHSMDLLRSLRLPLTVLPTTYLAALLAFWWLDDGGRDAVGWLLAEPKPNWQDVRRLLTVAAGTVAPAAKGPRRRRGPGVVLTTCQQSRRSLTTLKRWHAHVVNQNALAPLVRAMAVVHPQPKMQTSCAAAALAHVRGVGPYLAKNVVNTLFAHGFLEFDLGVVGPGALGTLAWLKGGRGTLQSLGFWPTSQAAEAVIARQGVARLAEMESCHWLDMQHALCLWRSSETGGPTR